MIVFGLSERARAFQGQTVELTRDGIGVSTWIDGVFTILRRTEAGERGVITSVSDAGFNGLQFGVRLTTGERINAYERDVRVVA